jgi:hypothetical protein
MPTPTSAELREHCERLSDFYPTRSSERGSQDRTWRRRSWHIGQQEREEERLIQDFLDELDIAKKERAGRRAGRICGGRVQQ